MKLPEATKDFESVKPGTYLATCFSIVDLGTHEEEYQGEKSLKHQLMFQWELPLELIEETGEPFVVSKWYTLSMHEKANLRIDLEAWRNKKFEDADLGPSGTFDIENVIGKSCLISVVEKPLGNGTKVGAVMALPKGTTAPALTNPTEFFTLEEPDEKVLANMSEWKRNRIHESREFQELEAKRNVVQQAMPKAVVHDVVPQAMPGNPVRPPVDGYDDPDIPF